MPANAKTPQQASTVVLVAGLVLVLVGNLLGATRGTAVVLVLGGLLVFAGVIGMFASFVYQKSKRPAPASHGHKSQQSKKRKRSHH